MTLTDMLSCFLPLSKASPTHNCGPAALQVLLPSAWDSIAPALHLSTVPKVADNRNMQGYTLPVDGSTVKLKVRLQALRVPFFAMPGSSIAGAGAAAGWQLAPC